MNRALIFDMDGTMVDNMMVHHRAWQQKLAELDLHFTLDEVIANCHGKNEETIERLFGDRFTPEERDRISYEKEATYREVFKNDLKLIDGLQEVLKKASELGIPMGIGTAARPENVDFVLDNLNIRHYFKTVITAADVDKGKPDPSVFFIVADNLGVKYEDCLVFEDSPTGAKTTLNAGMKAIILTTTHKTEEFSEFSSVLKCVPDYTSIDILEELKDLN